MRPRFAAAYLLREGDEAAFIDNNTAHSVPLLLEALSQQGLAPHQVRYIIITHVHLDHAGGSSRLMKECPNATLLAHPRAAPHIIDPSKLVKSAKQVYGEEQFDRMYGVIEPISQDRVRIMQDAEVLRWGGRELSFLHTRGHANHHFCIFDSASKAVFTGDSFGLAYPDLQEKGLFLFPSSSPTDFDPGEARKSIQRILTCGANQAYLTHFGSVTDLGAAADELNEYLDRFEPVFDEIVQTSLGDAPSAQLEAQLRKQITEFLENKLRSLGWSDLSLPLQVMDMDIKLNAAGLVFAAQKLRKSRTQKP